MTKPRISTPKKTKVQESRSLVDETTEETVPITVSQEGAIVRIDQSAFLDAAADLMQDERKKALKDGKRTVGGAALSVIQAIASYRKSAAISRHVSAIPTLEIEIRV
jgi:hypothetical protein